MDFYQFIAKLFPPPSKSVHVPRSDNPSVISHVSETTCHGESSLLLQALQQPPSASINDDGGISSPAFQRKPNKKSRKPRSYYSDEQIRILENIFVCKPFIDLRTRDKLAHQMNVPRQRISNWFQNRRSKWRNEKLLRIASPPFSSNSVQSESSAIYEVEDKAPAEREPLDLSLPKKGVQLTKPLKRSLAGCEVNSKTRAHSPRNISMTRQNVDRVCTPPTELSPSAILECEQDRFSLATTPPSTCLLPKCNFTINSLVEEDSHVLFEHTTVNNWPCSFCPKIFKKYFFLKNHFVLHHKEEA